MDPEYRRDACEDIHVEGEGTVFSSSLAPVVVRGSREITEDQETLLPSMRRPIRRSLTVKYNASGNGFAEFAYYCRGIPRLGIQARGPSLSDPSTDVDSVFGVVDRPPVQTVSECLFAVGTCAARNPRFPARVASSFGSGCQPIEIANGHFGPFSNAT